MKLALCVLVATICIGLAGCGPKVGKVAPDFQEMTVIKNSLQEHYKLNKGKKPAKLEDLQKHADSGERPVFDKINSGEIIAAWNVSEADLKAAGPSAIVAYPKDASSGGGRPVVLADLTVKHLTASEFDSAPKVAKK